MANRRKKTVKKVAPPVVIEHEPTQVNVEELYAVRIQYASGEVREYEDVIGTVTQHVPTAQEPSPPVPYNYYMIIQRENRDSIYVNMEHVEELTVGVQD